MGSFFNRPEPASNLNRKENLLEDNIKTGYEIVSHSPEETLKAGEVIGEMALPGDIYLMVGTLGAEASWREYVHEDQPPVLPTASRARTR